MMWHREYSDYKTDEDHIKKKVEPGQGIYGCEMHELHGWGNKLHYSQKLKHGWIASLLAYFFGKES